MTDNLDDDFANDKEIQRLRRERREYEQMVEQCIGLLSNELKLESCTDSVLNSFLMFNTLKNASVMQSHKSAQPTFPLEVSVIEYFSSYPGRTRHEGRDEYFFGLLRLNKEYPLTYIYKETLREKLVDLVVKGELDFPSQKKFSRNFFVVTQDKEKLSWLLVSKELNLLVDFPELEIEIKGHSCLFRISRRPLSIKQAMKFASLAKTMNKVFN